MDRFENTFSVLGIKEIFSFLQKYRVVKSEEVCIGTLALYKGLDKSQTVPMKLFSSIV